MKYKEALMSKNTVQFQKDMSFSEFRALYGNDLQTDQATVKPVISAEEGVNPKQKAIFALVVESKSTPSFRHGLPEPLDRVS
jgi:hypothetical protein